MIIYFFATNNGNRILQIQGSLKNTHKILVASISPILMNKLTKNILYGGHSNINARQINIYQIFIALFISWDYLPKKVATYNADWSFFPKFCRQIIKNY